MNLVDRIKQQAGEGKRRKRYTEWFIENPNGTILLKESSVETSIVGRTKDGVHLILQYDIFLKVSSFLVAYKRPEDISYPCVGVSIHNESGNIDQENARVDLLAVVEKRNKVATALSEILNG